MGEVEEPQGLIFKLVQFLECLHFESLACSLWCRRPWRSRPSRLLPSPTICVPSSPHHDAGMCSHDRTKAKVAVTIPEQ